VADPPVERRRQRILLTGDVPSPLHPPVGCNFNTRCPKAFDDCHRIDPGLVTTGAGHRAACLLHLPEAGASGR
jgi:oligopeptide/dipeptide ABC transporter ATP-binding protein